MFGVYVHIPFCEKKCSYCAFSSFAETQHIDDYISSLIKEIYDFHNDYPEEKYKNIDTIYIGGGTPSLLSIEQITPVFDALKKNFNLSKNYEFTIECNPNSLTEEKVKFYKENGVNRLSLGVQSLNDESLRFIGRVHNSLAAVDAIVMAKRYIQNISCDMLIGLKDMDKDRLIGEIGMLLDLGVKHISTYMLQVEEGTPLEDMVKKNPMLLPEDDECVDAYTAVAKFLKSRGFERYEVSNFALPGYESKHNFKYWTGEEYVGFGLSAHSLLKGERKANFATFRGYYERQPLLMEKLTVEQKIQEHIMLGLRCKNGIDKKFLLSYGYDIEKNENLKYFIDKNILFEKENKLYLYEEFYGINNFVIVKLLP